MWKLAEKLGNMFTAGAAIVTAYFVAKHTKLVTFPNTRVKMDLKDSHFGESNSVSYKGAKEISAEILENNVEPLSTTRVTFANEEQKCKGKDTSQNQNGIFEAENAMPSDIKQGVEVLEVLSSISLNGHQRVEREVPYAAGVPMDLSKVEMQGSSHPPLAEEIKIGIPRNRICQAHRCAVDYSPCPSCEESLQSAEDYIIQDQQVIKIQHDDKLHTLVYEAKCQKIPDQRQESMLPAGAILKVIPVEDKSLLLTEKLEDVSEFESTCTGNFSTNSPAEGSESNDAVGAIELESTSTDSFPFFQGKVGKKKAFKGKPMINEAPQLSSVSEKNKALTEELQQVCKPKAMSFQSNTLLDDEALGAEKSSKEAIRNLSWWLDNSLEKAEKEGELKVGNCHMQFQMGDSSPFLRDREITGEQSKRGSALLPVEKNSSDNIPNPRESLVGNTEHGQCPISESRTFPPFFNMKSCQDACLQLQNYLTPVIAARRVAIAQECHQASVRDHDIKRKPITSNASAGENIEQFSASIEKNGKKTSFSDSPKRPLRSVKFRRGIVCAFSEAKKRPRWKY